MSLYVFIIKTPIYVQNDSCIKYVLYADVWWEKKKCGTKSRFNLTWSLFK